MKRIIVYYSYTGHTKMIAAYLAKKLECDIVSLEPVVPYSTDYDTVVREEQNNDCSNSLREYKSLKKDLSTYDEIILGTPVWWYSITPVIRNFLQKENLKGKLVRPFATNAGWLGRTFKEIEDIGKLNDYKMGVPLNVLFTENHKENKLVTKVSDIDSWLEVEND